MRAIESAMATKSKIHSCHLLPDDRVLTFLRRSSFPKPKPWDLADPRDLNIRFCLSLGLFRDGFRGTTGKGFLPIKASEECKCPYTLTR